MTDCLCAFCTRRGRNYSQRPTDGVNHHLSSTCTYFDIQEKENDGKGMQ
jgi:hypothetical protein